MMENTQKPYRYQLEHCVGTNRKKCCPSCGHKTFVRYIDMETGKPLAEDIGRCDREINCGYHKKPKDYFTEGGNRPEKGYWFPNRTIAPLPHTSTFSTISNQFVEESLTRCALNNFSIWLISHFHPMEAIAAIRKYKIGGHVLWNSATVFWQIDRQNRVHAGKIMLYDSHTGHRIKSPNSRISWVHTQPGFRNFNIRQCLFGLHLLGPETETVAIVEAEKTAVVASMFFPDVLFLATGGITNLRK